MYYLTTLLGLLIGFMPVSGDYHSPVQAVTEKLQSENPMIVPAGYDFEGRNIDIMTPIVVTGRRVLPAVTNRIDSMPEIVVTGLRETNAATSIPDRHLKSPRILHASPFGNRYLFFGIGILFGIALTVGIGKTRNKFPLINLHSIPLTQSVRLRQHHRSGK
jgi:hypothetical protein